MTTRSNRNRSDADSHTRKLLKFARKITGDDPDVIAALKATMHLDSWNQKAVLSLAAQVVDWEAFGVKPVIESLSGPTALPLRARAGRVSFYGRNVRSHTSKRRRSVLKSAS